VIDNFYEIAYQRTQPGGNPARKQKLLDAFLDACKQQNKSPQGKFQEVKDGRENKNYNRHKN
jgi:hypothetical protein